MDYFSRKPISIYFQNMIYFNKHDINIIRIRWCNMSMALNKKIDNVQLEASRIVTGGTSLISYSNLYMETGWEKLKDRREKHKIVTYWIIALCRNSLLAHLTRRVRWAIATTGRP